MLRLYFGGGGSSDGCEAFKDDTSFISNIPEESKI